ncbi:DUF6958 family protein [Celeribacter sp.]|uniref:DUF6958 family protein n=1 Tax=Celeribacter sp. TaxID=1890673 RepID=UPI003A9541D7
MSEKIAVQNINTPDKTTNVDAAKYTAMKDAMLAVIPTGDAGLTAAQIKDAVKPLLPDALFPQGATSGWWVKCVQLDLEAKGILQRHKTKPLTFSKT